MCLLFSVLHLVRLHICLHEPEHRLIDVPCRIGFQTGNSVQVAMALSRTAFDKQVVPVFRYYL